MASLKQCIADKCKDCIYDHLAPGTWREQVEQCNSPKCALWPVRPMTIATINLQRKAKGVTGAALDSLVADLPDDEDEEVTA
jgi:hypothetical protein